MMRGKSRRLFPHDTAVPDGVGGSPTSIQRSLLDVSHMQLARIDQESSISLAPGIIYERFSRWQPQYIKTRVGEGAGPGAALARVKLDHKSGFKFTLPYLPAPFVVSIILRRRNKPSTGLSACLAIHSIFTLTAPSRQQMSSISSN